MTTHHIHHLTPISKFNPLIPEEFALANHPRNLFLVDAVTNMEIRNRDTPLSILDKAASCYGKWCCLSGFIKPVKPSPDKPS